MRLALAQLPSPAGDEVAGLAAIGQALDLAGRAGAAALVLPELMLPGYNVADPGAAAEAAGGPREGRLAALARAAGCALVLGVAERDGGAVYNSALAFAADGSLLARYRKIQLYGAREARHFTPGQDYALFDLAGCRAALLICYDVEFPGHVRALAERGARLILVPTANMQPFGHVGRLTVPAQAVLHGVTILYANYCGREGDLDYAGGSVAVGPDGAVIARAGIGPALLIFDLPAPDPQLLPTQLDDWRPGR